MSTLPTIAGTEIGGQLNNSSIISKTYEIRGNRIGGYIYGIDAVKQAVYKILLTERYENLIYSRDYGIEMNSIIGKNRDFAVANIEDIITDALLIDTRILKVYDFNVSAQGENLSVAFKVSSIYGEFDTGLDILI